MPRRKGHDARPKESSGTQLEQADDAHAHTRKRPGQKLEQKKLGIAAWVDATPAAKRRHKQLRRFR